MIRKGLKNLAAVMLVGIFVSSVFFTIAQADSGKEKYPEKEKYPGKVKITITCGLKTVEGTTVIDNSAGTIVTVQDGCEAKANVPLPFAAGSDIDVKIKDTGATVKVQVSIIDNGVGPAPVDNKYNIKGDTSNDAVSYSDDAGNDLLVFEGKGGINDLDLGDVGIVNIGSGNDRYIGKDITGSFTWNGGPGINKIQINEDN